MNALDELADPGLTLLGSGDTTIAPPGPAPDTVDIAMHSGGCLQDLVDLRAWRPRRMQEWLT